MDEVYKVTGPEIKIKNKTDILECEVKRALGSIATNRAGGGDLIVRFYKIWKSCSLSQKIEKDEHIKVISY